MKLSKSHDNFLWICPYSICILYMFLQLVDDHNDIFLRFQENHSLRFNPILSLIFDKPLWLFKFWCNYLHWFE